MRSDEGRTCGAGGIIVSKAKDLRDAVDEVKRDRWQCMTCSHPAQEDKDHCRYCEMYWEDVSAGLFDDDLETMQ